MLCLGHPFKKGASRTKSRSCLCYTSNRLIHDTRYPCTRIRIHGIFSCHLGRFPCSQNFRNFRFGGKWNTFRRFFSLENSQKKWKIQKDGTVFPNGNSCSMYPFLVVCTSSRRPRSGAATYRGLRPNGTTFYQSEIPLLLPPKFPLFFLNGKRPRYFRSDKICQYELSRKSLFIPLKPDDNLKVIQEHSQDFSKRRCHCVTPRVLTRLACRIHAVFY